MRLPEPKVVWEIGSRDGQEAQALSEAFPESLVFAFEPNPQTFPLVKEVAFANHKIIPKNVAISDQSGVVDFYQINTSKTITSWVDGNPGASSLLQSNGTFPYEEYVQDLIQVQSVRAAELIEQEPKIQPQILWIDVQGTEDRVLRSFEQNIDKVTAIVVELSLHEIYTGQALAGEVLEILKRQFYFVRVLNTGSWQFDALLVNKSAPHRLKHWMSDRYLKTSLRTKRKFGIARRFPTISQIIKPRLNSVSNFAVDKIARLIIKIDWGYPDFLVELFLNSTNSKSRKYAQYSRKLAEALLPSNPLQIGPHLPEISVLIPVVKKDFSTINLVIEKIVENSSNPISSITLVYAREKPIVDSFPNLHVRLLAELDLIPEEIEERIQRYPKERRGWVRQQVIKFLVAATNDSTATLVCDADTFLTHNRVWVNVQGVQQLQICHEYSTDYEHHFLKFFDEAPVKSDKISFVTHHQLMQKDILHKMFGEGMAGLIGWLELGNIELSSPISEYHSYGRFLTTRYPERCHLARWNNLFIDSRDQDVECLIDFYSDRYGSISAHRY